MSCMRCGGDGCGSSAGGPGMCGGSAPSAAHSHPPADSTTRHVRLTLDAHAWAAIDRIATRRNVPVGRVVVEMVYDSEDLAWEIEDMDVDPDDLPGADLSTVASEG